MGWADCGHDDAGRPIGYAFAATCDQAGCAARIDRGLSYCCGGMHGGGDHGCGGYFCGADLFHVATTDGRLQGVCGSCRERIIAEGLERKDEP